MSVLTNHFPDYPTPSFSPDEYFLFRIDNGSDKGAFYLAYLENVSISNTYVSSSDYELYKISNGGWVQTAYYNSGLPFSMPLSRVTVVRSSFYIYDSDNNIISHGTPPLKSTAFLGDTLTSDNLHTVFNGVLSLIPVLFVAILGCIAFRKAYNFLLNAVRGG